MNRRTFLKGICAAGACSLVSDTVFSSEKKRRPNVVFIIVDDSEFVEYGCYDGMALTPNIDKLANSGVKFENAFTSSSVCTPTRYTCLSGKYASRAKSLLTEDKQPEDMPRFVRWNSHLKSGGWNVASVLQKNGYFTGLCGKWHVGHGEYYQEHLKALNVPAEVSQADQIDPTNPIVDKYLEEKYALQVEDIKRSFGFDFVGSFYSGNLTDYPKNYSKLNKHNHDWITQSALNFIDESQTKQKPFFLYLSTTLQHGPTPLNSIEADRKITSKGLLEKAPDVQPGFKSMYKRLDDAGVSREMAPSLWLDDGVGAVMKKLKDYGIEDDTAVFFFSDQQSWGKGSCFDGGVRTPLIFSWKGSVKSSQVEENLVSNIDFVPTIFDICSVEAPAGMKLDGRSFLPLVSGESEDWRDAVFFELGNMRAVRTKSFKYIATRSYTEKQWQEFPEDVRRSQWYRRKYFRLNSTWKPPLESTASVSAVAKWRHEHFQYAEDADQLYDLRIDPSENMNLADSIEYQGILKRMKSLLTDWLQTMPGSFAEFKQ
ncbi:MAG: sulfatase [Sedimentisphaeraceae bacterium JB056]